MFKNIPQEVTDIIRIIEDNGFEAYMVGGCVRDCVMGIEPHDYDICTSALPEQTMEIFKGNGMVTAGLKHGTVGVIRDKNVYEITTYRVDGEYSDGRHPDSVVFTDKLKEDLLRRDFTINAMAYNPKTGLVDLYNGIADLNVGVIRCVGNPYERFDEDALRILRAIRFAARFDFEIEEETKAAMLKLYPTIEKVSIERINTEFTKTLECKNASRYIDEFRDIIAYFIPEIKPMFGFEQHNKYHSYDVWQHTMKALSYADGDIMVRLALFFHDIAKPLTFTKDEEGNGHFYRHASEGAAITKRILQNMRYSNNVIDNVSLLVSVHDFTPSDTNKSVKKLLHKVGEYNFGRLMEVKLADMLAHKDEKEPEKADVVRRMRKIKTAVIKQNECFDIKGLEIGGKDILDMGVKPGPRLGEILKILLDEVIEENIQNTREELIEYVKDNLL